MCVGVRDEGGGVCLHLSSRADTHTHPDEVRMKYDQCIHDRGDLLCGPL